MSKLAFYHTKSPKSRKAGTTHTIEISLPVWMAKSFCSQKWMEAMKNKHSKKIKFMLKPENKEKDGELETVIFSATGKHRETMRSLGGDIVERFNNMLGVIKKIVKE